jgi:hypothetical protein
MSRCLRAAELTPIDSRYLSTSDTCSHDDRWQHTGSTIRRVSGAAMLAVFQPTLLPWATTNTVGLVTAQLHATHGWLMHMRTRLCIILCHELLTQWHINIGSPAPTSAAGTLNSLGPSRLTASDQPKAPSLSFRADTMVAMSWQAQGDNSTWVELHTTTRTFPWVGSAQSSASLDTLFFFSLHAASRSPPSPA